METRNLNIKKELVDRIESLANELNQSISATAIMLLEYALSKASVKREVKLSFEPVEEEFQGFQVPLPRTTTDAVEIVKKRFPQAAAELVKRNGKGTPKGGWSDANSKMLRILRDNGGPMQCLALRNKYRELYNQDPGNVNSYMDTLVKRGDVIRVPDKSPLEFQAVGHVEHVPAQVDNN